MLGFTKDSGFQFGIRRTFPIPVAEAWEFMFSVEGLKLWLGELPDSLGLDEKFVTKSGVEGKVSVLKILSHVRMSWKLRHWENISILQVRLIENGDKTTISFHQEKLLNQDQREKMKLYWDAAMQNISDKLERV